MEETVSIGLWQNGIHFSIRTKKSVADKMGEIGSQDPERWEDKGMDLLEEAHRAVDSENPKQSQDPEQ